MRIVYCLPDRRVSKAISPTLHYDRWVSIVIVLHSRLSVVRPAMLCRTKSFMHDKISCMKMKFACIKMKFPCMKMKFPCMKMKFPCMKMKFPWMKMKSICMNFLAWKWKFCPNIFMVNNPMQEVVYSPSTHENFLGKKVMPAAKYSFSCMEIWFACMKNRIYVIKFSCHDFFTHFFSGFENTCSQEQFQQVLKIC